MHVFSRYILLQRNITDNKPELLKTIRQRLVGFISISISIQNDYEQKIVGITSIFI